MVTRTFSTPQLHRFPRRQSAEDNNALNAAIKLPHDQDYHLDLRIGDPKMIRFVRADITHCPADAIVNPANSHLSPGAGVCGAIHRAGGPGIAEECEILRSTRGPVAPGQAVVTTAGRLAAKYVVHTVGPVWHGGKHGEADLLASCYCESMRLADEAGAHSIAFPAISTGVYGYPLEQAARVAVPTLIRALRSARNLMHIVMVLFDKNALDTFATTALAQPQTNASYEFSLEIIS